MHLAVKLQSIPEKITHEMQSKYIKNLCNDLVKDFAHISISDSGILLIGTGGSQLHAVDLEKLRTRHSSFHNFVLDKRETQLLQQLFEQPHVATWGWCIKEACYKCGVSGYEPSDFKIKERKHNYFLVENNGNAFSVMTFDVLDGYALCIAVASLDISVIIDFDEQREIIERAARSL